MDSLTEMLAAVKACWGSDAGPDDFRKIVQREHPEYGWLYEMLVRENSAQNAYRAIQNLAQIPEIVEIEKEAKNHVPNKRRNNRISDFNPGGSHLRMLADGNVALASDPLFPRVPRHLSTQGTEIVAQRLRYA